MTPEEFSARVEERFPTMTGDVEEHRDLMHVVMGDLYRYTIARIDAGDWPEVEKVFRFLEGAYRDSPVETENAIRVSFLEYFDFRGQETEVRRRLGPALGGLYDDQMADIARLSKSSDTKRV